MIDLILHADTKATLATFARARGLQVQSAEGEWVNRRGVEWDWWAGSGKFRTGGTDEAPVFYPGFVIILRLWDEAGAEDEAIDETEEGVFRRSVIARYIKRNGTPTTVGTIPAYVIDGVTIMRRSDVDDWLAGRGLPTHVFL